MADKRFTLRLSPADEQALETLAADYGLDRSATLRRVLHAAARRQPLAAHGTFTALGSTTQPMPIQLAHREDA